MEIPSLAVRLNPFEESGRELAEEDAVELLEPVEKGKLATEVVEGPAGTWVVLEAPGFALRVKAGLETKSIRSSLQPRANL